MKIKQSKELNELFIKAANELAPKDLRVFMVWMCDAPGFSAGPQELSSRLTSISQRDIRRSLKSLVKQGYLDEELRQVDLKYGGTQTINFYTLKSTKAGANKAGANVGPANLLIESLTSPSNPTAEDGGTGETEIFEEQEDPEYWNRMVKEAEARYLRLRS